MIFLRDHDLLASGWKESLLTAFGEVDCASDLCRAGSDPLYGASANDLLFLHSQQRTKEWLQQAERGGLKAHLILIRSHGGDSGYTGICPRIHQCVWSPDEFISRPEPQQFTARITDGFPPDWKLLHSSAFPAALVTCCWLLGCRHPEQYKDLLETIRPVAVAEASCMEPLSVALPERFTDNAAMHDCHFAIRNLLDATWQNWAPFSPVLVARRRLSHDWCEKRGMHVNPFQTIISFADDLQTLINGLPGGFMPSQYFPLVRSHLNTLTSKEIDHILLEIDETVEKRHGFCDIKNKMQKLFAAFEKQATATVPETAVVEKIADSICECIHTLPKGVPLP